MTAFPVDPKALGTHFLATGARPAKEYKDGAPTGKTLGHRLRTLLVDCGYQELNVLVPGDLTLDFADGQALLVRFDNLVVRPYVDKNKALAYSATADAVHVVPTNTKA